MQPRERERERERGPAYERIVCREFGLLDLVGIFLHSFISLCYAYSPLAPQSLGTQTLWACAGISFATLYSSSVGLATLYWC